MNGRERRKYRRYNTEMRAELYINNETISAIMIDVGKCCMGLISEKEISPGTEVQIWIKHTEESSIQGTVIWMKKIREFPRPLYRMGIETKGVIFLEDIAVIGFPEQSEYIKSLISKKRPIESVLVIDDEEAVRNLFKGALEKFGYEVTVAVDGEEGLAFFREHPTDLIITDIFMPKKDGHTLILEIKEEFPKANIFAITGKISFDPEMELDIAKSLGAAITFKKPVKFNALLDAINGLAA